MTSPAFFRLPLEVRQQIYLYYLKATYLPQIPATCRRHFCYILFSHRPIRQGYAITGSRLDESTLRSTEFPNFVVEIDPPLRGSAVDPPIHMVNIWNCVRELCDDLRVAPLILSLSIQFMEDETATWSSNGKPYETMNLGLWIKKNRPINCDVLFVLRIFARLTNTPMCKCLEKMEKLVPGRSAPHQKLYIDLI